MRKIIAALATMLLATQAALAQPARWTEPTGSFRLTLPDGWETFEHDPRDELLRVGPRGSQSGPPLRECTVGLMLIERRNVAQATQDELNAIVASWSQNDVEATIAEERPHVLRYVNERVNGVQVQSMIVELPEGVRAYRRTFILARVGAVGAYSLNCGISPDAEEADRKAIEALFDSLTFIRDIDETP